MSQPYIIHYLRDENGYPYGTIAFTTKTGNPHLLKFGMAMCRKGDHFVKKIGRMKAAGRLKSDRECYSVNDFGTDFSAMNVSDIIKYILNDITDIKRLRQQLEAADSSRECM